jgi:hypothetical protein
MSILPNPEAMIVICTVILIAYMVRVPEAMIVISMVILVAYMAHVLDS